MSQVDDIEAANTRRTTARRAYVERIEEAARPIISLLVDIKPSEDQLQRVALSLICTQIELFAAIAATLKSDGESIALTILRSMLEAQADLFSLLAQPSHLKRMQLETAEHTVDVLEGLLASSAGKADRDRDELRAKARGARAIAERLGREGFKLERKPEKFKRAGLEALYISFQILCSHSHNDLTALSTRHLRGNDITLFEFMEDAAFQGACKLAIGVLAQSIGRLPEVSDADVAHVDMVIRAQESQMASLQGIGG